MTPSGRRSETPRVPSAYRLGVRAGSFGAVRSAVAEASGTPLDEIKAPLLSHDAQGRPGETIVGRRDPALHEGSMKTVRPLELDGIVIGHIAKRVGPAKRPRRPHPLARIGDSSVNHCRMSQTCTACSTIQSPDRSRRPSQPPWPFIGPLLLVHVARASIKPPSSPWRISSTPS